jgi:hypothetical protein
MGAYEGPTNFLNVGAAPSLMLNFAREKSLEDQISGNNLITFTRSSVGTYVGADGLIKTAAADEPRFDHDPVTGESLGLLIEEQRINLFPYSENFSTPAWENSRVTLTPNATQSPNGNSNATKIAINSGQSDGNVSELASGLSVGQYYTESIFLKQSDVGWDYVFVWYNDAAGYGFTIELNLTNGNNRKTYEFLSGRYSDTSWKVEPYPNGWYKISLTAKKESTGSVVQLRLYPSNNPHTTGDFGTPTVTGADGTKGCYVWGAQLERGSFPTSYIPTRGSQVTRQPDITKITGTNLTSFYNQSEGTVFASFRPLPSSSGTKYVQSSTIGSTLEMLYIRTTATGSDTAIADGNVTQYYKKIDYTRSEQENSKHAYAYALNNSNVSAQGILGSVDTSCTMPTITRFDIGSLYQDSTTFLNGYISQLIYYPARISDIKLQQMTKVFS